jgi:hypothetical protein
MHISLRDIPSLGKNPRIRQWFPIIMLKNGDRMYPYSQTIELNGVNYSIE